MNDDYALINDKYEGIDDVHECINVVRRRKNDEHECINIVNVCMDDENKCIPGIYEGINTDPVPVNVKNQGTGGRNETKEPVQRITARA